jgi:hypothetical protein
LPRPLFALLIAAICLCAVGCESAPDPELLGQIDELKGEVAHLKSKLSKAESLADDVQSGLDSLEWTLDGVDGESWEDLVFEAQMQIGIVQGTAGALLDTVQSR